MSFPADSSFVDDVRAAVSFGERKFEEQSGVFVPDILLLHYTGMDDAESAVNWLCGAESGVSCHYLIYESGRIVQMVSEEKRAFHAGFGAWQGQTDTNSRSIGIEIVNGGHPADLPPYPQVQMESVARLCQDILSRYPIAPQQVLAHSDIAPERKSDPGEHFDWAWLAQQGIGHWVLPAVIRSGRYFQQGDNGEPVEAIQSMLSLYGYDLEISGRFCRKTREVVTAFQRHFRQERVDGVADVSTLETLHNLLSSLPKTE